MTYNEYRAQIKAGALRVIVSRKDMLQLLDERESLRAEAAALRQAVERVRVNALEEAAQIADTISDEQDVLAIETTDDHAACAHRQAEEVCWRIAAAIRARSDF